MSGVVRLEYECVARTMLEFQRQVWYGEGVTTQPMPVCSVTFLPISLGVEAINLAFPPWADEHFEIGKRYNIDVSEVRE